jgi:hypothetical protein
MVGRRDAASRDNPSTHKGTQLIITGGVTRQVTSANLNTLLWVFVVQLDSDGQQTQAEETAKEALERLRSDTVRVQRLQEALPMEERIACFYDAYDKHDLEKGIREQIRKEARKADAELLSLSNFLISL